MSMHECVLGRPEYVYRCLKVQFIVKNEPLYPRKRHKRDILILITVEEAGELHQF